MHMALNWSFKETLKILVIVTESKTLLYENNSKYIKMSNIKSNR